MVQEKEIKGHLDVPKFSFGELDELQVVKEFLFACFSSRVWTLR